MNTIRVNNLQSAKRLLSRLIKQLQSGQIENTQAKDLCYLLTSYVNIYKVVDIEHRITELETKLKGK